MDKTLHDIRYGVRMLLRNPGFSAVVVIALALGIGATTALFTVVNAVLLRPLAYRESDRLITVWEDHRARSSSVVARPEREWTSLPNFLDWRDQNTVFERVAAFQDWGPTLTTGGEPEGLAGMSVSHDMFELLGVVPSIGRSFRPEEDQRGADRVVLISHSLWQRRFGSDSGAIGAPITLGDDSYTVLGVMPAGFLFPGTGDLDVWRPLQPAFNTGCGRGCVVLRVIARLNPDATIERARSEMQAIAARLADQYPESNAGVGVTLVPLKELLVGDVRVTLLVLLGAVAFVLLIACANVANLLLARASAREREMAIRSALGAGRFRIIRQLLTESLILSVFGGALGLLMSFWMVDFLVTLSPDSAPRISEVGIDRTVLGFTFCTAVLTGIIFGLTPALRSSRPQLSDSLQEGRGTSGKSGGALRSALVISEVALALVLLIGAGLLMKSFVNLLRVDSGFDPSNVLTLRLLLPAPRYPERQQTASFYAQLMERIKSLPGVESSAAVSSLPLGDENTDATFLIEGRAESRPGAEPAAWYSSVTPDYFDVMKMRMISGRRFTEEDRSGGRLAVIINQTMARRYFPGEDPIGKRIGSPRAWREIIGVVGDVKHFGLDAAARPSMYFPHNQIPQRGMTLVVRAASSDPLSLVSAVRGEVGALDGNLALTNVNSMERIVSRSVSDRQAVLLLLGIFAGLAMLLAAVGIYGVMAYAVTQRTHEIGIRIALGAGRRSVLALVLRQGMLMCFAGVAIGLAASFAFTRVMSTLLYAVSATDPLIFAAIPVLLVVVALAAILIPARRAMKVEPMVALRYE